MAATITADDFIAKWAEADGSEFANAQSFVGDLCRVLEVETPRPAVRDNRLALLNELGALFLRVADLSRLQG